MCWTSYALGLMTPLLLGLIGGWLAQLVHVPKLSQERSTGVVMIDVGDASESSEIAMQKIEKGLRRPR
jgi:hypothetical protein